MDLGIPAKAIQYEGFNIRVWQDGDLSGGRVSAPMGIAVASATFDGMDVMVGDFWLGAIDGKMPMSVIFIDETSGTGKITTLLNKPSAEDVEGISSVPARPILTQSPYGLIDGEWVGPDTVYVQDQAPTPCLFPFLGEGYYFSMSSLLHIDLNQNGTPDRPLSIFESFFNFYAGDGTKIPGRTSYSYEGIDSAVRVLYGLPFNGVRQVEQQIASFENWDDGLVCARVFTVNYKNGPTKQNYYAADAWNGIPAGLKDIITDTEITPSAWPIGGYAFAAAANQPAISVHGVNVTNTNPWTSGSPADTWFASNPSEEEWKLFYAFYGDNTPTVVSSAQFIGLLDALADVTIIAEGSINWNNARRMLQQLFPWPNPGFNRPYDSAMFSDGVDVYTWTRKYGSVKISKTGIFSASLTIPAEVTSKNGVRPEIVKAGTGLYLCICNDVGNKIDAIYKGSPFASWTALAPLPEGFDLLHVRPIKVTEDETFLLGVCKSATAYHTCLFDGEWRVLSKLPTPIETMKQWSVSLFGTGKMVQDMADFLSPPHVLPQMPVGPYEKYSIGLP